MRIEQTKDGKFLLWYQEILMGEFDSYMDAYNTWMRNKGWGTS